MCFLRLWVLNYETDCHEIFRDFFMHICSTFPYKVNIKVCKIERKKVFFVQKWWYPAIPGTSPISVYAQN